jgi:2-dehydro-3-deoxyphosphooctonate aldolase (KDO 8-P synthase)
MNPNPVVTPNSVVTLGNVEIGNAKKLTIIAGPCQLESRAHAFDMAGALKEACGKLGVGLVDIRKSFDLPVLTDVHERDQCAAVAQAVDVLQIPAFLSRQTDLLVAAAHTGKCVNVKKGQFLSPWDMKNVIAKITGAGNPNVLVTERGVSFGYNTLVSDMRALPIMAGFGAPVVFDATHSVQQPGGQGDKSGGDRTMVPYLARAAVAAGVACVFMEVHQDPDHAPSDGPNMVRLKDFPALLEQLVEIDAVVKR